MKFRRATPGDHPLMREETLGEVKLPTITVAFVSGSKEGPRYWVVVLPYALGQFRLQVWWERWRGTPYPDILHQL